MGEHPHNRAIANMNSVSSLIRILNESREAFIRKNLSIHLHPKELTLIKQIQKHIKPHHKQVRINRYKKLQENPDEIPTHYELHLKLYLARYKKLEKKGLINVEENPENGLPYDMEFTDKGNEILEEISQLEDQWDNQILEDIDDKEQLLELLRKIALPALGINYSIQKEQKGVY